MGQQGSVCCCCGSDKRASEVLNDSLQVKLLEEETNVTVDTRQSSERLRLKEKESSTRHAGVATTDGDADSESARSSELRKAVDDDEDQFDELYPTKSKATALDHTGSSYSTSNAWDLSQDSQVDFESSVHSQQEISASDLSLVGARIADLSMRRLESDASTRSNREDSYASSHDETSEQAEEEEGEEGEEEQKSPKDSLRRRSVARPSSSRVFDDEGDQRHSQSRGLTELIDQGDDSQGFGSYGSNSSLLQSFVSRDSDSGTVTSFADSQRVIEDAASISIETNEGEDADKPPSPTSDSPRHKHKKKKKGKHSPRSKHH